MIISKFNKRTGILDSKFVGVVVLQDIVEYIRATKNNVFYPRILKILTDATKSDMNLVYEDLEIIVAENFKSIEQYDCIIDAIIVENPKETALTMLYKELVKTGKYKFNIFSTREAAIKWLENY